MSLAGPSSSRHERVTARAAYCQSVGKMHSGFVSVFGGKSGLRRTTCDIACLRQQYDVGLAASKSETSYSNCFSIAQRSSMGICSAKTGTNGSKVAAISSRSWLLRNGRRAM